MKCEENGQRVKLNKENRKGTIVGKMQFPSGLKYKIKIDGNDRLRHRLKSELTFLED